jgi:hypothetical protein
MRIKRITCTSALSWGSCRWKDKTSVSSSPLAVNEPVVRTKPKTLSLSSSSIISVPAKMVHVLCCDETYCTCFMAGSISALSRGVASPVIALSSTKIRYPLSTTMSQYTIPGFRTTTSPGTTYSTGSSVYSPSRRTLHRVQNKRRLEGERIKRRGTHKRCRRT